MAARPPLLGLSSSYPISFSLPCHLEYLFWESGHGGTTPFKYLSPCQFEYSAYLVWESSHGAPFPSIFLQDRILGVSGTPFALRWDSGHCGAPLLRGLTRYHPLSPGQSFSIGQTVSVVRESGHGGAPSFHLIYINRR